jgi:hypothetical protein
MNALFVTAFKDIGRGQWSQFVRPSSEYMDSFDQLVRTGLDVVCFMDEETATPATPTNLRVHPYDEDSTFIPKYKDREQAIMESGMYRRMLSHRLNHPEHSVPLYNLVNHNKVAFIKRARDLHPDYAMYVWIDFHYARHGTMRTSYTLDHLPIDRVTIASFCHAHELPEADHQHLAMESKETIVGSVFVVPHGVVDTFYGSYEAALVNKYEAGVADDDQNVHAFLARCSPELYNVVRVREWGAALDEMAKPYGYNLIPDTTDAFSKTLRSNFFHFAALQRIIEDHEHPGGCGSYLMDGRSLDYCPLMYAKQASLFKSAQGKSRGIEIGWNAGHSLLILLLAQPTMILDAIDILEKSYTTSCMRYLQHHFHGRIHAFVGDSHRVLAAIRHALYDFVHIDGMHEINHVKREIDLLKPLCLPYPTVVLDDITDLQDAGVHARATFRLTKEVVPVCPWTHGVYTP